jgi:hypothetical protein
MSAPTPSNRTLPTGYKMPEGFKSLITCSVNPAINIWEIEVKPPGVESGEAINTTTQQNIAWRTFWLPQLKTLEQITIKFAYDADVMQTDLIGMTGPRGQTITILFPQGTKVAFYGDIMKVEFDPFKEKEFPTGTLTIVPTNTDAAHGYVEAGPAWSDSGTG